MKLNGNLVPRSPHFNGLAEAAVKSAKWHMRKVLHSTRLTYDEMGTVVAEIEAILNSRPLTPMSTNPNDLQPLTAGQFLIGSPLKCIDDRQISDTSKTRQWYKLVELKNQFWERWSRELQSRTTEQSKMEERAEQHKSGNVGSDSRR